MNTDIDGDGSNIWLNGQIVVYYQWWLNLKQRGTEGSVFVLNHFPNTFHILNIL